MPKRITYDNFGVQIGDVPKPDGSQGRVLSITERTDAGEVIAFHEFIFGLADARSVGAALQGTAVVTAPADTLARIAEAARQQKKPPGV